MPVDNINGANLFWELSGDRGDPLILVHGSWGDHTNWNAVTGSLSGQFRVLTYDRRGHSLSERSLSPETVDEDVKDLIGLTEYLGLAPAHIAGNSFGASIVLKAAVERPDIFRTMIVHEPPLFGLLRDLPEMAEMLGAVNARIQAVLEIFKSGEAEAAARQFVETISVGPGGWQQLPDETQGIFINNAQTFYDEMQDNGALEFDLTAVSEFDKPSLLTFGDQSPPFFPAVINRLAEAVPHAQKGKFDGAGHIPHVSHPKEYIQSVSSFINGKN